MNRLKLLYRRADSFFSHIPLFFKYLTVFTSLVLVSYLVLSAALFVFMTNNWSKERKDLLLDSVQNNAEYSETILSECKNEADMQSAMLLIYNNIGIVANTTGADMMLVGTNGKVILCSDTFTNGYSNIGEECLIHKGVVIPEDIMNTVQTTGKFFSTDKIFGLFSEKTYFAGAPIIVNGTFTGAVFASISVEHSFRSYIRDLVRMYLSSAVFAAALSFLAVYALTARLTDPLRQMSNATKAYAKGDFSKRISVRGSDEFAELCTSFNKMASALAMLESSRRSFVANVSHELKTPMTTIGGFIDGMLDGTIPKERHEEYLAIVSEEIKRLSRLVTSMLNLSKIEAGELELKYSNFDLSSVIISSMLTFEQIIEKRRISVEGLENIEPITVNADRDMLHQVIYNLVDNAVKFTDEGGTISVAAGKTDKGETYFSIRNTGEGISPEELNKIFERFYKVDKSRSYDVKSAGLGLYLCKTIVEMHNGQIYAESTQGEFTRFTFTLGDSNFPSKRERLKK